MPNVAAMQRSMNEKKTKRIHEKRIVKIISVIMNYKGKTRFNN